MKAAGKLARAAAAGARLYLRPVTLADAGPAYLRWMNDPLVNRYLESRFAPVSLPGLRDFVRGIRRDKDTVFLAIVLKRGDRHIGNIKLGPINRRHGFGEIGLLVGEKDCWGKGYATEAIEVLCDYAFGRLGLHKLTAGAYAVNRGSIRAFLKAGFALEGRRRSQYLCDGAYQDLVVMGRVAGGEPRARTAPRDPSRTKGKRKEGERG